MYNFKLKTNLKTEDIVNKLNSITEKFYTNSKEGYKFEGKISASEFQIFPTFDFGPKNQLRPEINGEIIEYLNHRVIILSFKIPSHLKLILFLILLLNISFTVFLFINPIDDFFSWKILAFFIVFTAIAFYINFKNKANASLKILTKILNIEMENKD
ncbi:hypothetical protein [Flavobacterium sp. UBA7680]|uniref:hypothetical protein n=1 Tax=Flavobacterium sp. UBA7680 TaxID=1946559 RepID=UPI0025BE2B18|nr:hypothetical protein [Flavobacterium sp. UBA7680]